MLHVSPFGPVHMFLAYRQVCEHSLGQAVPILHMKHPSGLLQKVGAHWEVMGCSSTEEGKKNTQHFEMEAREVVWSETRTLLLTDMQLKPPVKGLVLH